MVSVARLSHASLSSTAAKQEDDQPTQGSRMYAIIVCVFASLGGLFFGYDQGVTGGVLVMPSFLEDFCHGYHNMTEAQCKLPAAELPSAWLTFTTLFNVTYYLGCIFGAYCANFICDQYGRRVTIFWRVCSFVSERVGSS